MKRSRTMICLIAVISLLASVIWHSPVSAATVPALQSLGQIGVGQAVPSAIDVDGQGNIFVADPVAQAVVEFDQYGAKKGEFLVGQVTGRGVAVSQDGLRVYASANNKVLVVNPVTGEPAGELTGSVLPAPLNLSLPARSTWMPAVTSSSSITVASRSRCSMTPALFSMPSAGPGRATASSGPWFPWR